MTPIDTLYFQWVVTEEEKKEPSIFESIVELPAVAKVNDLLNTYASMISDLIEAEVNRRAVIDEYVAKAKEDPELEEMSDSELAEGILALEDVQENEELVEAQRNALDMFHENLVKVLANEE